MNADLSAHRPACLQKGRVNWVWLHLFNVCSNVEAVKRESVKHFRSSLSLLHYKIYIFISPSVCCFRKFCQLQLCPVLFFLFYCINFTFVLVKLTPFTKWKWRVLTHFYISSWKNTGAVVVQTKWKSWLNHRCSQISELWLRPWQFCRSFAFQPSLPIRSHWQKEVGSGLAEILFKLFITVVVVNNIISVMPCDTISPNH